MFELDLTDQETLNSFRQALGLDVLETLTESLASGFEELLAYMNVIDSRVQELGGEPTVTETIRPILSRMNGQVTVHRELLNKIPGSITIPD